MTPAELRLAIAEAMWKADGWAGDLASAMPSARMLCFNRADAALRVVREAMREPSYKQVNGGGIAILETRLAQERQPIHSGAGDQAVACWRAMLAASPLREPGA